MMSGYFLYHSIGMFEGKEAAMRAALVRIAALDAVLEKPALIRIEPL